MSTTDMFRPAYRSAAFALVALLAFVVACGDGDSLILATTTSTNDSGLLDELVPLFEDEAGVNVKIIAVGTGQALEMGRRGDADVLLVHAPSAEEEFVGEDYPLRERFARLTAQEERFGLYEETTRIGLRRGWEETLAEKGVTLRGHRVVRRREPPTEPDNSADGVPPDVLG